MDDSLISNHKTANFGFFHKLLFTSEFYTSTSHIHSLLLVYACKHNYIKTVKYLIDIFYHSCRHHKRRPAGTPLHSL